MQDLQVCILLRLYFNFLVFLFFAYLGSVVAARLSENEKNKVLLLEAGTDISKHELSRMPIAFPFLMGEKFDWSFPVKSQKFSGFSHKNNQTFLPRGKCLGGSSRMNAMLYVRGSRYDYDSWAEAGAKGWSYEEVLPFFLKSEGNNIYDEPTTYRNTKGPLNVSKFKVGKGCEHFINAAKEIGFKERDFNAEFHENSVWRLEGTIKNGIRHSTDEAFLRQASFRPNLHILTGAHVTKILINSKKIATGVEYFRNGKFFTTFTKKEIILSAGAFESPKILMQSGIGPKDHLESFGIPVIQNLPVGNNLQDHVHVPVIFQVDDHLLDEIRAAESFSSILNHKFFGEGYLGSPVIEATLFTDLPTEKKRPLIQMHYFGSHLSMTKELVRRWLENMNFKDEFINYNEKNLFNKNAFSIYPCLLHPKSIGSIRLSSANPFEYPEIETNTLKEEDDVNVLLDSVRTVQKLLNTDSYKKIGAKIINVPSYGCQVRFLLFFVSL